MKKMRWICSSLLMASLALAGNTVAMAVELELQTPDGASYILEFAPDTPVEQIRQAVRERTGILPSEQRLMLGYQLLDDETLLEDYWVEDGDILRVSTYDYVSTGSASQSDWNNTITLRGTVESGTPMTQVVAKGIMYKRAGQEEYTQLLSDSLSRDYSVALHNLQPGVTYQYYAFVDTGEKYYEGEVCTFTPGETAASFVASGTVVANQAINTGAGASLDAAASGTEAITNPSTGGGYKKA